jgi:predicted Zn-dependent peptidase
MTFDFNFSEKVFPGGLKLVLLPRSEALSVTVLAMVAAGSKYESKKENGLSHFLEHMCFKGTKNRPNAKAISSELDSLGARSNAFTSFEYTGYYITTKSDHLSQAIEIVADVYLNSTYAEAEIEKEKGVIIEEIKMYRDIPNRHIFDLLNQTVYGNQPAGWNVAGDEKTVRRFTRQDFLAYHKRHYVAQATTVVVAGNFDSQMAQKLVGSFFADIKKTKPAEKIPVVDRQQRKKIVSQWKKTDQTHLGLGFRGFNIFDKRVYPTMVLSSILGEGMSSRLFLKVRDELGAAYYVFSEHDSLTDHGLFSILAGVDTSRAPFVMSAILAECRRLKKEKVTDTELTKAKNYIIGNLHLGLETSHQQALFVGLQKTLKGKISDLKEQTKKIEQVTASDVKLIAQEIFQTQNLNLALIGPHRSPKVFARELSV